MNRSRFRNAVGLLTSLLFTIALTQPAAAQQWAGGVVFEDLNRNGARDPGEPGLPGVGVSNQKEVVETDRQGRWKLPADDDITFFVIKPGEWMTPLSEDRLPRFYYTHKPNGSPKSKYPGVEPTGPLPESIDFPLHRQKEPDTFKAIFFGDPQPRTQKEIDYIAQDVVEELIGTDATFGVTLGDILFDDLSLFDSMNATVALIGIPWYNVIGNHDINFDAPDDKLSDETFERIYGPNYYSFDYGKVHFIVLDNVDWDGRKRKYTAGLGGHQLEFVRNDLARVPEERLVVLMMHIPLGELGERGQLFRLIEKRPYTLSLSGHTHWQAHQFFDQADGWRGKQPHHHIVNVTVSGSWWKGAKDELGIPHTTMRDGAPNGYSIITFDGHEATFDFKAARRPADYQMNIYAPEEVSAQDAPQTEVYVNVFAGSGKSTVHMRVGWTGPWTPLLKTAEHDPNYVKIRERDKRDFPKAPELNAPIESAHLWKAKLPKDLHPGTFPIFVKTRDMYGREFQARRAIRIK